MRKSTLTTSVLIASLVIPGHAVSADGGLDPTWGTGGVECASGGFGRDIELLPSGSIYTAGYYNSGFHMVVNRTLATGLPDTTFDGDGTRVIDDFVGSYSSSRVEDIVVMSDGDLMLIGFGTNASTLSQEIMIVRLASTGALDTTFNGSGLLTLNPSTNDDLAYAGVEMSDGDVVIAGYAGTSLTNNDLYMARINPNGTFDSSFSGDGILIQNIEGNDQYYDLVKRSDGSFRVAGKSDTRMTVAAVTAGGVLDTSFNTDGYSRLISLVGEASSLALQSDGKIVIGGWAQDLVGNSGVVARLDSNGDLDLDFNTTGYRYLDGGISGFPQTVHDVIVQSDSKISAFGTGYDRTTPADEQLTLFRVTAAGGVDTTFNASGTPGSMRAGVTGTEGTASDEGRALTTDSAGRLFGATRTWTGSGWCIGIARFDTSLAPTSWTDQTLASGVRSTAYSDSVASNLGSSATYSVTSGALPTGLTLATNGSLIGTPSVSGSFPVTITATTGAGTLSFSTPLVVLGSPINSDTTVASTGSAGVAYIDGVSASGYPSPTYSVTSGTLPTGVTLDSSTGAISGTPTVGGTFTFSITASNSQGTSTIGPRTITVSAAPTWTDRSVSNATVGRAFNDSVAAGGYPAPTYSLFSGTMPPGINLNASTGALVGSNPRTAGSYTFVLRATNASGT
ncbi:MAG: putative Ig domain-containing protein, partial [Ilumatobacteraceae bacterium]